MVRRARLGAFPHAGSQVSALLIGIGLVTAVPLFLFAYAARAACPTPPSAILQYIGPSLQLACGVLIFHERFDGAARGRPSC